MRDSELGRSPSLEDVSADLTKLAFALVSVFLAYGVSLHIGNAYVYRYVSQPQSGGFERASQVGPFLYLSMALFVMLEMLAVIWAYRPLYQFFEDSSGPPKRKSLYDVALGVGGGLAGAVVAIPLLGSSGTALLIDSISSQARAKVGYGAALFCLLGIALPITMEIVFRGIAQRTLQSLMRAPAAVLVGAVLFADLSPVFPFAISLLLGAISGSLFWWRRNLLTSIAVNVAMTLSLAGYMALRIPR